MTSVYVSLSRFDSDVFSLSPTSDDLPVVLMDADEMQAVADGRQWLIEVLDKKVAAGRDGHMYLPVR